MKFLTALLDRLLYRKPTAPPWIQTWSGKKFHFLDPRPEDICIDDIAHALSLACRFAGHVNLHYSVAEHSVRASWIVPEEDKLAALLHDATEAYLGDVSKPLKNLIGATYTRLEDKAQKVIFKKYGLDPRIPKSVHEVDVRLLLTERRDLFDSIVPWSNYDDVQLLNGKIEPWSSRQAESSFVSRFQELYGREL